MSRYIDAEKLKAENRKHFPSLSLRCELNYIINEIPTAPVRENVHGEWFYTVHYDDRYRVCSNCGTEWKDGNLSDWNFCPNCGADMRKGEKNELR